MIFFKKHPLHSVIVPDSTDHPTCLQFVRYLTQKNVEHISDEEVKKIAQLLANELAHQTFYENRILLENLFAEVSPAVMPSLLDILMKMEGLENIQAVILFLLKSNRPIFQIKGLQKIISIGDSRYTAFITPLLFSTYKPLQQQAIRTLFKVPGNGEIILEKILTDRSANKRAIAKRVLRMISPNNAKLAMKQLESGDFLERIAGIERLSQTQERKFIGKIEPLLQDPDIAVQRAALDGIAHLGGRKAKKILTACLHQENYPPLQKIILSLLASFE